MDDLLKRALAVYFMYSSGNTVHLSIPHAAFRLACYDAGEHGVTVVYVFDSVLDENVKASISVVTLRPLSLPNTYFQWCTSLRNWLESSLNRYVSVKRHY